MSTPVLTVASQIQCMHGGLAVLTTTNTTLCAGGSPVLLESDTHVVVGCPFTAGLVYLPCVIVQWQAGATSLSVNGVPVLVATSIGQCLNAAGVPQGIAIATNPAPELGAI
jgi:hypothetical protein